MAGRIKGASIREILRWHERNGGREQLRAIARGMPAELRADLDLDAEMLGMMPSTWYPAPLAHVLLDGMFVGMTREKRTARMREAAHAAIRATARGVYKLALEKLATPRIMAANIQRLWSLVHDDGLRTFVIVPPAMIESTTRDWTGHALSLCELMTENSAAVLETMGLTNVTVERVECVAHGAPKCMTRFRWDPR